MAKTPYIPITYVNPTTFTVPSIDGVDDLTPYFQVNRRIQILKGLNYVYGIVDSSSYTTTTIVTVTLDDSEVLDATCVGCWLGIITPEDPGVFNSTISIDGFMSLEDKIKLNNVTDLITYEALDNNNDVGPSAGQLAIGDHLHYIGNVKIVAKSGGEYTSIQSAIDSITDATTNNRYTIFVYPGTYTENIVMKDYVSLVGLATRRTTKIYSTSGTLITLPSNEAHIFWIDLEMAPTSSDDILLDATAGNGSTGFYRVENTDMRMVSANDNISPRLIVSDAGIGLYLINVTSTYTMSSTVSTGTFVSIDLLPSNNLFYYLRSIARATIGSANGDVHTIYDESNGRVLIETATIEGYFTNGSNTGQCNAVCFIGGENVDLKQLNNAIVTVTGNGSGDGYTVFANSNTNNMIVDSSRNIYEAIGFTNNRRYNIGTGDTIRSYFNKNTYSSEDVVNGTLEQIDVDVGGQLSITTPLKITSVIGSIASDSDFDNNSVLDTTILSGYGLLVVSESVDGVTGLFRIENESVIDIGSNSIFSTTENTAGKYNVYFKISTFKVQNKVGNDKDVKVVFYGTSIST